MRNGLPEITVFLMPIMAVCVGLLFMFIPVGGYLQDFSSEWEEWALLIIGGTISWGIGGIALLVGIDVMISAIADMVAETPRLVGTVSSKKKVVERDYEGDESKYHTIWVDGRDFRVSEDIYRWVKRGEEVAVSYWLRSERMVRVDKVVLNAGTS